MVGRFEFLLLFDNWLKHYIVKHQILSRIVNQSYQILELIWILENLCSAEDIQVDCYINRNIDSIITTRSFKRH